MFFFCQMKENLQKLLSLFPHESDDESSDLFGLLDFKTHLDKSFEDTFKFKKPILAGSLKAGVCILHFTIFIPLILRKNFSIFILKSNLFIINLPFWLSNQICFHQTKEKEKPWYLGTQTVSSQAL